MAMEMSTFQYVRGTSGEPYRLVSEKGTYPLYKLLGEGAYGSVYTTTDRRVVKLIVGVNKEQFEQETIMQMKVYEAVAGSCPKIYDFGKGDTDDEYVIVMEQFDDTARAIIKRTPDIIPDFLRQVARILQKLEPFEFNHRDFKSDNVMYRMEDNKIKFALIDFGFACITVDGKKYAGTTYFKKNAVCFRRSRDLAQLVYDIERYTQKIPNNLRTFLRLLLTFDIKGKKCEMFWGCHPYKINNWIDTYDFLNKPGIENPHTTPEGILHAIDVYEQHGIEACKNGFVVDPVKDVCVPKPSDVVVVPKDKPVTPVPHILSPVVQSRGYVKKSRKLKDCSPGKIRNSATRRCIKAKPDCPPGKVRNPDSGRCVNEDGAIGRRLRA